MGKTEKIEITNIAGGEKRKDDCVIVEELPLTVFLNGRELVTTLCSPAALDCLAVGMLAAEGIIESLDEIKEIRADAAAGSVRVETAGSKDINYQCFFKPLVASGGGKRGGGSAPSIKTINTDVTLKTGEITALMGGFLKRSEIYWQTGGVHSAALCDNGKIILFHEDIGRHNAIDKVFGECMLRDIPLDNRFIITSGRISSEILLKVARRGVPILITKAAPTSLGVVLAEKLGITVVRAMRDGSINVYSHDWRILISDGK